MLRPTDRKSMGFPIGQHMCEAHFAGWVGLFDLA
jgi:hypothetical protein